MPPAKRLEVAIGDKTLSLSNLDKVLYPRAGFTKGQVIDYYTRIAPVLLPHLHDRPLTLKRYPNGVEDKFFYEKRCPSHAPSWVQTADVFSGRNEGNITFCLCQDLPTLVWLANLADLELHTPLARAGDMKAPTIVAFDLDPGPPATVVECARVALELRRAFDFWGLSAFAKTSGSKGMQVYLPLNTAATYEETRAFSSGLAQLLERRDPDLVVSEMTKAKRGGKVFVDWSQNASFKTTVNVYSLRAMERPTVSTPLTWDEVSDIADGEPVAFTSDEVLERVGDAGRSLRRRPDARTGAAALMHRIVVVGGGFAGVRAARALAKAGGAQITLIDRTNHFVFQPLLYQVATGLLSGGQISPALRGIFRKFPQVRVLLGEVEGFDLDRRGRAGLHRAHVRAGVRHADPGRGRDALLLRARRLGGAGARDEVRRRRQPAALDDPRRVRAGRGGGDRRRSGWRG